LKNLENKEGEMRTKEGKDNPGNRFPPWNKAFLIATRKAFLFFSFACYN